MKAGFFERLTGGDKPFGTASDATRLLQEQKIEEGRELLRRLIKHDPGNLDALALGVFELQRPPADTKEGYRRLTLLEQKVPGCAEVQSLWVLANFGNPGEEAAKRWSKISETKPATVHGAALRLMAFLSMSDIQFQLRCKPGFNPPSGFAIQPMRGTARLLIRQHAGALECFEAGLREATQLPAFYEEKLKVKLLPEDREQITAVERILCRAGSALTRRDLGKGAEARAEFQALAEMSPFEQDDLSALSLERP